MFELGWIEIALIGVIALIVLGPERLPKAARFTGLWVRKARAQWFAVKAELEREIAADGLKEGMQAEARILREAAAELRGDLQDLDAAVRDPLRLPASEASDSTAAATPTPPLSVPPPERPAS